MGFLRVFLRQDNIEIFTLTAAITSGLCIFSKHAYIGKDLVKYFGKKKYAFPFIT